MTRELRDKTFSFRLKPSEYEALVIISEKENRKPGDFLRNLLEKEITARTTHNGPTQTQSKEDWAI